jgi:hypothetical protein
MRSIAECPVHVVGNVPLGQAAPGRLDAWVSEVGDLVAAVPDSGPCVGSWPRAAGPARPGDTEFGDLGYASEVARSYRRLRTLRGSGLLPRELRLQVNLPTPATGVARFVRDPARRAAARPVFERALLLELHRIVTDVPAEDLSIQWNVRAEVVGVEAEVAGVGESGPAWEDYIVTLRMLSLSIPHEALVGYHFCYRNGAGEPGAEPVDLATTVRMANAAVDQTPRNTDFFHMAVPASRADDAYFAPLAELERCDARLFLGLVHDSDGAAGATRRIGAARRRVAGFGISTSCGLGDRSAGRVATLFHIQREVLSALRS